MAQYHVPSLTRRPARNIPEKQKWTSVEIERSRTSRQTSEEWKATANTVFSRDARYSSLLTPPRLSAASPRHSLAPC